jgi:hypothetical protein
LPTRAVYPSWVFTPLSVVYRSSLAQVLRLERVMTCSDR